MLETKMNEFAASQNHLTNFVAVVVVVFWRGVRWVCVLRHASCSRVRVLVVMLCEGVAWVVG